MDIKKFQKWRDLFIVFAYRDLSIRYKQSILGIWWALLKPALTVIIFTLVFSKVLGLKLDVNYPYWFFVVTGIVPWLYFSFGLSEISNSILSDAEILKKVAFPRILSPFSALVPSLLEFVIGIIIIFMMYAYFGNFNWRFMLLPFSILLIILSPIGFGLIFAALNVFYRDFRFVIPFALQVGIYMTPIAYQITGVPDWLIGLISLNPMVMSIEIFRWCLGVNVDFPDRIIVVTGGLSLLLSWVCGVLIFNKLQSKFADSI
jgi:lipopolysaccharide transport system permease protein